MAFLSPASLGGNSSGLDRQLIDAAESGNLDAVEALLAAGADVNAFGLDVPGCCQYLDTALHQAVRYWNVCPNLHINTCTERRTKVILVLLAAGADVNAPDKLMDASPWTWPPAGASSRSLKCSALA